MSIIDRVTAIGFIVAGLCVTYVTCTVWDLMRRAAERRYWQSQR